jgi:hypothetical protein
VFAGVSNGNTWVRRCSTSPGGAPARFTGAAFGTTEDVRELAIHQDNIAGLSVAEDLRARVRLLREIPRRLAKTRPFGDRGFLDVLSNRRLARRNTGATQTGDT